MKIKQLLLNLSLILFLAGVLLAIDSRLQTAAAIVLSGGAIAVIMYFLQIIQLHKSSQPWKWHAIALTGALFSLGLIFIHGFSVSMGMMLFYRVQVFTSLYFMVGILLPLLLYYFSIKLTSEVIPKRWLHFGTLIGSSMGLLGFLGFAQIIPLSGRLIFYSWIWLLAFYFFFVLKLILTKSSESKTEWIRLLVIAIVMIGFCIYRFATPGMLEGGLWKAILFFGVTPLIILPLTIVSVRKLHAFTVFVCYFIFLDFFFIHTDSNLNYLVKIGINGCVDYDLATDYPINEDPGIPIAELLKEPNALELEEIAEEWALKDFSPKDIQVVYENKLLNGDSIKVISHLINGQKHYGAIRIPKNVDVASAPILLELEGGGTGMDVSGIRTLTAGKCKEHRNKFISILPSFRGCVLRGNDFCFRSEGYYGDAWLGPAEDAIAFLEAAKSLYNKSDSTKVLAQGGSRGATVALIIGGLTEKLDYIIATSTHTNFLDEYVLENERVGNSYSRAFFTPSASPQQIRKKIIASSPLHFAKNLPPFEVHQGTEDQRTTVRHAEVLRNKLLEIGRDSSTFNIHIWQGEGHGYDDDQMVCQSMTNFLTKKTLKQ